MLITLENIISNHRPRKWESGKIRIESISIGILSLFSLLSFLLIVCLILISCSHANLFVSNHKPEQGSQKNTGLHSVILKCLTC